PVPLAGSLKTTVDVGGKRASVDAPVEVDASAAVDVVDHVDFAGLAAGKEYTFAGRLMELGASSDGSDAKVVASASVKKVVDGADGTVDVVFAGVKLEPGKTYVVFESASSTENLVGSGDGAGPHVVKHEDASDKSQTVKVKPEAPVPLAGSLKTTVDVGGKRASVDAPVEVDASAAVDVVDHVDFAGLAAGKEYTFAGRLMELGASSDGSDAKVVASASVKKVVDGADGTVDVVFAGVKLEPGKTYVVFESASSTENLVGSGDGAGPHVVKHEDASDKSQTVKVKPEAPVPPAPNIPEKPGNPSPDKPSKPGNPAPNTPEKPGNPSPNTPQKPGTPEDGEVLAHSGAEVMGMGLAAVLLSALGGVFLAIRAARRQYAQ
ncbi:VaFE repeat-containing surface-anchored protein, partial [Trueperella sp. LYQ143]|uniref:VaFE repeat-containing surface-anchored protein n=1 Tax=Trueperella sp. LYQ143 TaxID=3391059 RepID=UPI0039832136